MHEPDDLGARLGALDPQELYNLETLRKRLKGAALTPRAVGEILPEAVIIGEEGGGRLSKSMTGITERAIEASIREDPETLSTALFPIIGSAIRKALDRMVAEMMATMDAGLERALSFKRLGWRLESWRSGVPFMEIVLRETLRYRVEHVFLIHKKTGILLREASLPDTGSADSDMVASMLEAVRAYIKDSLSLKKSEAVEAIKAGDFSLLVEDGPFASVAVVMRGAADPGVRELMQETLEFVHSRLGPRLKSFSGDTAPFEAADPFLARCLISKDSRDPKAKPVYAIVALSTLAAFIAALVAAGAVSASAGRGFEEALDAETGIVVARSERRPGRTELRVLRDPRARSIQSIAAERGVELSRYDIREEAFTSPDLADAAPDAEAASPRAIPQDLLDLAKRLGELRLLFEQDSGELRAGQEASVRTAGDIVAEIVGKAKAYGVSVFIEVVGHSAGAVQDEASLRVSEDRALKALSLFAELNASMAEYARPRGAGVAEPVAPVEVTEDDRVQNRSVTFKAVYR